jgi:hypothetical protein
MHSARYLQLSEFSSTLEVKNLKSTITQLTTSCVSSSPEDMLIT